jgi:hypothetical protein
MHPPFLARGPEQSGQTRNMLSACGLDGGGRAVRAGTDSADMTDLERLLGQYTEEIPKHNSRLDERPAAS